MSHEHYERNCSLPYLSTALTLEKIDCYSPLFLFTRLRSGVLRRLDDVQDEYQYSFLFLTNGDMSQRGADKDSREVMAAWPCAELLPAFVACGLLRRSRLGEEGLRCRDSQEGCS